MNTTTRHIRITSGGELYIDDEIQAIPEGLDPSQIAFHALHIEAAGCGKPIQADVQDDRSGSHFSTQVTPDGSSHAPDTMPPPGGHHAYSSSERLAAAQAAGRAHDMDTAVPAAEAILQELSTRLGDTAQETLEVAQFRADLAFLSGDFSYATAAWTWLALAWFDRLGPGDPHIETAARNATASWMRLSPTDAIGAAQDLLSMLLEVAPPDRTAAARARIEERLRAEGVHRS